MRQAHGPADREAGDRHQCQRHPARTIDTGRYEVTGVAPDHQPVDGYPGLVQFRAPAVRNRRSRCRGRVPHDGRRFEPVGRLSPARKAPSPPSVPSSLPAAPTRRRRDRRPLPRTWPKSGYLARSAYGGGVHVGAQRSSGPRRRWLHSRRPIPPSSLLRSKAASGIEPALPSVAWRSLSAAQRVDVRANDQRVLENSSGRAPARPEDDNGLGGSPRPRGSGGRV